MATNLNLNEVNKLAKGQTILAENELAYCFCLLVKGKVEAINSGSKVLLQAGNVLGLSGVYLEKYLFNYVAAEDTVVFPFSVKNKKELITLLEGKKEYNAVIVNSLMNHFIKCYQTYDELFSEIETIGSFCKDTYLEYKDLCLRSKRERILMNGMEDIADYVSTYKSDVRKYNYYINCAQIPVEVQKKFYEASVPVSMAHIEDLVSLVAFINTECQQLMGYLHEKFQLLISGDENCLYKNIAKLAMDLKKSNGDNSEARDLLETVLQKINTVEKLVFTRTGYLLQVDRQVMEDIYFSIMSDLEDEHEDVSTNLKIKYTAEKMEDAIDATKNAFKTIVESSTLEKEVVDVLEKDLIDYINLTDKSSTDDSVRLLRKRLTENFYKLYNSVFEKAYHSKHVNHIAKLFLDYGFLDERLLTKEQLVELYYLPNENTSSERYHIYTMTQWLTNIFNGSKEPSKSEFDQDYSEMIRALKNTNKITTEEEREYHENSSKKLSFEIENMYRCNNRIVNGHISTFVPFLIKDNFINSIGKSFVSGERIEKAMDHLRNIDYSTFYREVMYINEDAGVSKEYIMQEVLPDLIILPIYGVNSVMWQEITGKRRNSEGRFLLPAFCDLKLEDLLVKVFGRFRWELCRTSQGTAWNNIKYKSLTSEYSDYIQFYRKNRELSETRKEKVKLQIQKGRNNLREIFVIDYELWVQSEADGSLRLNKVARELLATYCPFNKEIREKIAGQPLFSDAMARYYREKAKKLKELGLRYRGYDKKNEGIPTELKNNYSYYNEL